MPRELLVVAALALPAVADSYSPDAERDYPTNVYWGDTHVHTSYSTGDANFLGGNVVTPEIAYRFAQGEPVEAYNGMTARIRKPLDFLVIADHAEGLGIAYETQQADAELAATDNGRRRVEAWQALQEARTESTVGAFRAAMRLPLDPGYHRTIWQRVVERAEAYNDPGKFTTFAGYEWTSLGSVLGVFGNLHRVVVFRDGPDKTGTITPFSATHSRNPEDLWAFLEGYRQTTGGDVIAIPHNSNLGNGEMFARHTFDGGPLTRQWAARRQAIEPLVEITQQKGDSEAHPVLSPTDEFADFETWHSWAGYTRDPGDHICCAARKDPGFDEAAFVRQKRADYVRPALKTGLDVAASLGVNPFKFGVIGSTDTHVSFASADNENYWAQYPNTPPSATRPTDRFTPSWERPKHWETAAAGYAAVWAPENTRASIFAAMRRREVYATTGPRITVRMFGGWEFVTEDAAAPNIARVGYAKGVPMGGDLAHGPPDASPTFLVAAVRDPDGANLDRVQVIKGWRTSAGELRERVYDVALSDGRDILAAEVPAVGSTVDVANASYHNTIGDPQLATVWRDPAFDAGEHAFYYVRVLEIPTPRWPAYDAKHFGVGDLPDEVLVVTQERAYTSPIWYAP